MANFAKIGPNNTVMSVTPLADSLMKNADDVVDETVGQQYLESIHGWPAELWVQCSYNTLNGKHYDENGDLSSDQSKKFRGTNWDPPVAYPSVTEVDSTRIEFLWNEVNTRWQTTDNSKYWNASSSAWTDI
mgnify:CR=1 FL=1